MSIFTRLDESELLNEDNLSPNPKNKIAKKLAISMVGLGIVFIPIAANGQDFGRIFDGLTTVFQQIRQQNRGGGQPTQAQVDQDARDRTRMERTRRAVDETREFYRNVSAGNRGGIFDQVLRLVGEFGVMNPATMRQAGMPNGATLNGSLGGGNILTGSNISGKPTTVSESITLFNIRNILPSLTVQTSLEGVTGNEGQKLLAEQRAAMLQLTEASGELATLTAEDAKISAEIANGNSELINRIQALSSQSRARQASQDVLKDLAQQQSFAGNLLGGLSLQQERNSNILSSISAQMQLQSAQNNTTSFQLTQQLLQQAQMSSQLAHIEGEARDARNYEIARDGANYRGASTAHGLVFIYGLNADPGYGLPVPANMTLTSR